MAANDYNATLVNRIDLNPQLVIFQVKADQSPYPFKAGQFAVLGLRRNAERIPEASAEEPLTDPAKAQRLIRRAYSISSASHEEEHLEFYISLVSSGALTPRLLNLKEGDRLFVGKKAAGVFTLDKANSGKNVLLMSTGTGLAPYISMIRSEALGLACPQRRMAVLHGAAYSWDLGYRRELETLRQKCHNLTYLPMVSRPKEDRDWQGHTGWITKLIEDDAAFEKALGIPLDPQQTEVFLCGNPNMVESAEAILTAKGYEVGTRKEPGTLHREKYW